MKTKIIATIGPTSLHSDIFQQMVKEGIDYVRVNMAYATLEQVSLIKENIKLSGKEIPIIYDIRSVEVAPKLKEFGVISHVALSFTESADQLKALEKLLEGVKVIAKIETQAGIDNFNEILENSWGVMIARGDLGESISLEKVPGIQKLFSKLVKKQNKFLVIATEMLLSMVEHKQPTRAEVSDVANAVYDLADAVMLSEETAIGRNPVEAVSYMRRIIYETEKCMLHDIEKESIHSLF